MTGSHLRRAALLLGLLVLGIAAMLNLEPESALRPGQAMPAISAELAGGGTFDLAAHRGEVVVLNFWASWCLPCRKEAPALSRLKDSGVSVVGLAVDPLSMAAVADKARAFGMRYPVGRAAPELIAQLGIRSVPTTCVVSANGLLSAVHRGLVSDDELAQTVRAAR